MTRQKRNATEESRRSPELQELERPVEALPEERAEQALGADGTVDAADYVIWRKVDRHYAL